MNLVNIFWFRRDLRLEDNHGLYKALSSGLPVLPIFIFDTHILDKLDDREDPRVTFIYEEVTRLKKELEHHGSTLLVYHGKPLETFSRLLSEHLVHAVFTNHDYEPYAIERDRTIEAFLRGKDVGFFSFKDQVIFEKNEVVKSDGQPYTVFTPYSKKWKELYNVREQVSYPSEKLKGNFKMIAASAMLPLNKIGFHPNLMAFPERSVSSHLIENYGRTRDFPFLEGTSRMGIHLRFGTVSIRQLAGMASQLSEVYLNELIWREFYMMVLWHFPHVVSGAFKPVYDRVRWKNDEAHFKAWRDGMTGYPIVDAGMRQLNSTGYMHNRLRMITASFLTKHLLIDWRWGEAYFASRLLDYELSSNNGGWQWAAGTGCDAAPYFRIFNPDLQTRKFDPELKFVLKWVPEYGKTGYPARIVDHAKARTLALSVYRNIQIGQK